MRRRILTMVAALAVLAPLFAAPLAAQDAPTRIVLSRDLSPREMVAQRVGNTGGPGSMFGSGPSSLADSCRTP